MKPIYIRLKKSRHATQPWRFEIDRPGPAGKQTKKERYTSRKNAYRGAIRQLGLEWKWVNFEYYVTEKNGKLRPVKMLIVK